MAFMQTKKRRRLIFWGTGLMLLWWTVAGQKLALAASTVSITQPSATSIASQLFPAGIELTTGKLLITEPEVIFIDAERLAVKVKLQAYDHRPAQNIALSERGWAKLSGRLAFDRDSREILLHNPKMDALEFDRQTAASKNFRADIANNWANQVGNPVRAELPPHPYIVLFRDNISDISYDGEAINVEISYE